MSSPNPYMGRKISLTIQMRPQGDETLCPAARWRRARDRERTCISTALTQDLSSRITTICHTLGIWEMLEPPTYYSRTHIWLGGKKPRLLYCTFYLGLSIYSHSVLSFPTLVVITPFYLQ